MNTRFPMPAGVVGKILRLAADPDADIADLARLLESDAVLSAQVLKAINSATFGLRHKVAAVDRAVMLMGLQAVRNLVLSLCVRDLLPTDNIGEFPLESFWKASLRRAASARCLAERLELPHVEEFFTLGLCQDIGILVRLHENPGLVEQLQAAIREPSDRRLRVEGGNGESHDETGFTMFSEWGFPDELTQPVRYHHRPEDAPEAHRMSARVAHAAEALADLSGTDDPKAAIQDATVRLAVLGLGSDEIGEVLERVNLVVEEFASLLGLELGEQMTFEQIVATASAGLVELNLSYEELNRKLREALVEQQRMAAELETLNRKLDHQARTDSLTGLPNRRSFDEQLLRELAVAQRQSATVPLLIVDIDRFKQLNDTYGHLAGDRVLAKIGEVLKIQARVSDFAARYGGEEFAIILPFTPEQGGRIAAERIRLAIEATVVDGQNDDVRVTASVGGATIDCVQRACEEGLSAFVQIADEALYDAKRTGRNRVCWNCMAAEPVG